MIITDSGEYIISGQTTENRVFIDADSGDFTITLNSVDIDVSEVGKVAFEIKDNSEANVNLILVGENKLKSRSGRAGIQKNGSENNVGTLTISGTGSIEIDSYAGAACIGGAFHNDTKNITIESGNFKLTSHNYGAGLGGGESYTAHNILIKGGSFKTKALHGSGIGAGGLGSGGSVKLCGSSQARFSVLVSENYGFDNVYSLEGSPFKTETDITAKFKKYKTILIEIVPEGQYLVSAAPSNYSHGTVSGFGAVASGGSVTLTATPATNYKFVKWTKNDEDYASTDSITIGDVSEDMFFKAVFTPVHTLTVESNDDTKGTVSGGGVFAHNAVATVRANAKQGHYFVEWKKGSTQLSTDAVYEYTVEENVTLTAYFADNNEAELQSVRANGASFSETTTAIELDFDVDIEGLSADCIQIEGVQKGELEKLAGTGKYKLGIVGANFDNNTVKALNVAVPRYTILGCPMNVTLFKSAEEVSLSAIGQNGTDEASTTEIEVRFGLDPELEAADIALMGAELVGLRKDSSENTKYILTITNIEVADGETLNVKPQKEMYSFNPESVDVVVRKIERYVVEAVANDSAFGDVAGAGEVVAGRTVTLVATPNEGYHFVEWTESGSQVSTEPSYSFEVSGARSLVAVFEQDASSGEPGGADEPGGTGESGGSSESGESGESGNAGGSDESGNADGSSGSHLPYYPEDYSGSGNHGEHGGQDDEGNQDDQGNVGGQGNQSGESGENEDLNKDDEYNNPVNVGDFDDVKSDDWYYNDVKYMVDSGLMAGTSENEFSPETKMTRGMIATVIWRLENAPTAGIEDGFLDVDAEKWYSGAISWAKQNQIMNGYSNEIFGPDDNITREEVVLVLYNYVNFMAKKQDAEGADENTGGLSNTALEGFKDKEKVSSWAKEAMEFAVKNGIIKGKPGELLDPQGECTRAELSAILKRFMEMMKFMSDK